MNEKVKAINPQIVVHGTLEKPYYEISYYDTSDNKWHIGYSSYDLQIVKEYLDSCFEVVDADVEPVKRGEWITINSVSRCSNCEYIPPYDNSIDDIFYSAYCPNCGAKMDGKEIMNNA